MTSNISTASLLQSTDTNNTKLLQQQTPNKAKDNLQANGNETKLVDNSKPSIISDYATKDSLSATESISSLHKSSISAPSTNDISSIGSKPIGLNSSKATRISIFVEIPMPLQGLPMSKQPYSVQKEFGYLEKRKQILESVSIKKKRKSNSTAKNIETNEEKLKVNGNNDLSIQQSDGDIEMKDVANRSIENKSSHQPQGEDTNNDSKDKTPSGDDENLNKTKLSESQAVEKANLKKQRLAQLDQEFEILLQDQNVVIDFMKLAEKKYGFDKVHPEATRNGFDFGSEDIMEEDDEDVDDEEDDEGNEKISTIPLSTSGDTVQPGVDLNQEHQRKIREANKRSAQIAAARARVEGKYDLNDPFIDDSELLWEEQAASTQDGFFVYSGPLVSSDNTEQPTGSSNSKQNDEDTHKGSTGHSGKLQNDDKVSKSEGDVGDFSHGSGTSTKKSRNSSSSHSGGQGGGTSSGKRKSNGSSSNNNASKKSGKK